MKISTNKELDNLYRAILALKTPDEARRFFRDLLTEKELEEFSNRWKAARLLDKGTPYTEIVRQTNLSSATISRISKWLNGGMGGYKLMLKKLNHHRDSSPGVGKGLY